MKTKGWEKLPKHKMENKIRNLLEIPRELTTNEPKITIVSFNEMLIENYKGVLEYEDYFARVNTYMGIININGFNLNLNQISSDDIIITGKITSIEIEEQEE